MNNKRYEAAQELAGILYAEYEKDEYHLSPEVFILNLVAEEELLMKALGAAKRGGWRSTQPTTYRNPDPDFFYWYLEVRTSDE